VTLTLSRQRLGCSMA